MLLGALINILVPLWIAYTKDKKRCFSTAARGQNWQGRNKETRIKSKAVVKYKHSEAFAVLYICKALSAHIQKKL